MFGVRLGRCSDFQVTGDEQCDILIISNDASVLSGQGNEVMLAGVKRVFGGS